VGANGWMRFPFYQDQLYPNKIDIDEIGSNAVASDELVAASVTSGKVGSRAVLLGNIAEGAVTADELATNAVETVKIADANVTYGKWVSPDTPDVVFSGTVMVGLQGVSVAGIRFVDEGSTGFDDIYTLTISGGVVKVA